MVAAWTILQMNTLYNQKISMKNHVTEIYEFESTIRLITFDAQVPVT